MAAVTRTTAPTPVPLPDTGRRRGRATPRRRSCQRLLGQPRLEATSVIREHASRDVGRWCEGDTLRRRYRRYVAVHEEAINKV